MRRVILLFLDGVGLGEDDATVNPLAASDYPTLSRLLDGHRIVQATGRHSTAQAELAPTDAQMGVPGRPQSATGQAAILTGVNAPHRLGEHYGPRPDDRVRAVIDAGSIFSMLAEQGKASFFCNAYPPGYFAAVARGKRLLSAIPYAVTQAGQALCTADDLLAQRALAADFTNQGWRQDLGYDAAPVLSPVAGGELIWKLAQPYSLLFFEHWQTDVLGHHQDMEGAVADLLVFDGVLGGLLAAADLDETLILVTSDHGNVEDCRHGKHTENPAVTLVLGAQRQAAAAHIHALTDLAPVLLRFLDGAL